MSLINFLLSNWDSALLIIAVIVGAIVLYRRGEVSLLENVLFAFVVKAEREFGGGTGELKKAAVVGWVYERLPKIATLIISRQTIERLIESVLAYAKQKWAANPKLSEYISGQSVSDSDTVKQLSEFLKEEINKEKRSGYNY